MNSALMFSKASDEWSTPQAFFDALDAEFCFSLDAAASRDNHKCRTWFGPNHPESPNRDALARRWATINPVWLNPPYSRCLEFIAKAAETAREGDATVVCLVPSRTDTRWWHEHVWDGEKHQPKSGVEVRFQRGRLKFGEGKNSAPFPSVVIIFRPEKS